MSTYEGRKVYHDAKGYACVWIEGKNRKVHILEWEKANGPKPKGFEIHHRDENKGNWELSNLELMTNSDHQKTHAGWVRQEGKWVAKPCTECGEVLPLHEFYQRKGLTPSARCKPCHCSATKRWAEENPEKRRAIGLSYYCRRKEVGSHV